MSFDKPKHIQAAIASIKNQQELQKICAVIPKELYREMKLHAAQRLVSIQEIMRESIKEYLSKRAKE